MENTGLENVGPNRMGGNRRTGKRRTKIPGVEKAGLENAGTSCVWVAKHNIINVHVVRGHVMYSNSVSIAIFAFSCLHNLVVAYNVTFNSVSIGDLRSFEIRFEFESDVPIRIRFESDVPIQKF